ncbi:MAG: metallophosphoesterase [Caldilineaceae bacterium]
MAPAESQATDLTFIHLTDLHLLATEDAHLNGQYPLRKVHAILERVHAMEISPDFWLITGDLVNNGQPAEYQVVNTLLEELRKVGAPVLLGMGNHDSRIPFYEVVLGQSGASERPYYYSVQIGGVNLIMLDSQVPNAVHGHLDQAQLAWLATELARPTPHGHLIALHHPPVHSTVALLDSIMLVNPDDLAAVIAPHNNILGILSGHIHYSHITRFHNTVSITTPAALYTIDPGVQKNFRTLSSFGFAVGTIRNGQLFMNPIMMPGIEIELEYRQWQEEG